jgi:hypothetical protein
MASIYYYEYMPILFLKQRKGKCTRAIETRIREMNLHAAKRLLDKKGPKKYATVLIVCK